MKSWQIGQIVDYCIDYNARHKPKEEPTVRKATREDIRGYFGRGSVRIGRTD